MSEWISVKDRLPEEMEEVIVCNYKGMMFNIRAIYHPSRNIFVFYCPASKDSLLLEVTHWYPLPKEMPVK